ncbi:6106_t:CDS:2 [Funneliformis mosseae]|uniref:6106_t:CDS:1 n=1 Tax=Funneliformis mosseae TaxID=27381 RepID=A0A9N9GJ18_FUNMO|nr:6106_t:CDS:2 [Funneliformis mosseae]
MHLFSPLTKHRSENDNPEFCQISEKLKIDHEREYANKFSEGLMGVILNTRLTLA